MKLIDRPGLAWYFRLFNFVAKNRIAKRDIDPRQIHTQLVVVLSTGILMWAYTVLAFLTISSPVPGIVGFIGSSLHLLSPLLFRVTNNSFVPANVLLAGGIAHQTTFSYFSGGFDSNILIWFGILPMIGGVICGKRGALQWMTYALIVSLIFFILQISGHHFPYLISAEGRLWSQGLLVFGWIFLSSTIVAVYAGLRENSEALLHDQSKKIDDLFRVLFHDLANPLGRIAIGISLAQKTTPEGEKNRGLEIAKTASDSMIAITQNIRKMYAVSKGKANVDLTLTSLNSAMDYVLKIYAEDMERKKVSIDYNFKQHMGIQLLVEPVSFNNQVLGNIISNAIKFSSEGSHISVKASPVDTHLFTIEIKDNGIGIPKSLINQLFDITKKTSRPGTQGETGTGFGMHIMKSFVEMYGGDLQVESIEKDEGVESGTLVKLTLKGELK